MDNNMSGDDDIDEQFIAMMRRARSSARDARYKWERARTTNEQTRQRRQVRRQQRPSHRPNTNSDKLIEMAARLAAAQAAAAHAERHKQAGDDLETVSPVAVGPGRMSPADVIARARANAEAESARRRTATTTPGETIAPVVHLEAWRERARNAGLSPDAVTEALGQSLDAGTDLDRANSTAYKADRAARGSVEDLAEQYTLDNLDEIAAFPNQADPTAADLIADAASDTEVAAAASIAFDSSTDATTTLAVVPEHDEGASL